MPLIEIHNHTLHSVTTWLSVKWWMSLKARQVMAFWWAV